MADPKLIRGRRSGLLVQPGLRVSDSGENSSVTGLRCVAPGVDQEQGGQGKSNMSYRDQIAFNEARWRAIRKERESGNTNPRLAAAEHFAYARLAVSENGISAFLEQVISVCMYQGMKLVLPKESLQLLKTGLVEVSPPSLESFICGLEGADEGLKDYIKKDGSERLNDRGGPSVPERVDDRVRMDSLDRQFRHEPYGREWA